MYRLGLEAILGLRREGDVLRVEPCIPRDWAGYEITYRWGESVYRVRVENPEEVSRGVAEVVVDGEVQAGGGIRLVDDGAEHEVRVRLG